MKMMKQILITFLMSVLLFPVSVGQGSPKVKLSEVFGGEIVAPADYAYFKSEDSGKIRLEVYYQIFNRLLRFEKVGEVYEADFEVSVVINDRKGNLVDNFHKLRSFRVATQERAESRFDYRTNQVNFDLSPGKYKLAFTIVDNNSDRVLTHDEKIHLKAFDKKHPQLSQIEWVNSVQPRGEKDSKFDKADATIIPSVNPIFGGDVDPRLMFYVEIYSGREPMDEVLMETVVRNKTKGMVYRDTLWVDMTEPIVRQVRNISIDGYIAGEYELYVRLKGRRNKKLDQIHEEFQIKWSQAALIRHEYDKAVDQLALIAEKGEIEKLREPKELEARTAAFNRFWRKHDPVPETPENEAKREFYRRLRVVNSLFSYTFREGWRTDRGRVYVRYGEPDQMDDYPIVPDRRPYQTWHYYTRGRYRKFTFIDENEDGDYRLAYPYDGLSDRPDF